MNKRLNSDMIKRGNMTQEPAPPAVCDVCGRPMSAQMAGQMLCLQHYEQSKAQQPDPIHAELLRRIEANPEWQPQPHETSRQYNRRMFALTKPLLRGAVKRMQKPLT